MGVVNNEHRITKLEEEGGGGGGLTPRVEALETSVETLDTDLSHLEDEYTNLVSYKTQETEVGEWIDGRTIYRRVVNLDHNIDLPNTIWTDIIDAGDINILLKVFLVSNGTNFSGTYFLYSIDQGKVKFYNYLGAPLIILADTKFIFEYVKNEN